MNKVKANTYVRESDFIMFRQIAKQRDIKQAQLFNEMLQAYLIVNAKDQKEEK